jgi:hypothetical protein
MAYIVTREDLRGRLRDEIRYCSTSGAAGDADLNRRLAREVARVWERMIATSQGVGMATLNKTIAVGEPDGFVPGERVPLPDDFRRLVLLRVDKSEPGASTPQELESLAMASAPAPGNVALLYYLDGPGQDTSVSPPVPTPQQIRLYPDWRTGQVVLLVYAVQPPTIGDPADPTDDAIELDLIHEPAVRYVVARTLVRAVSREDQQGYQRAQEELEEAQDEFTRSLAMRAGPPPALSSYRHRPGRWAR